MEAADLFNWGLNRSRLWEWDLGGVDRLDPGVVEGGEQGNIGWLGKWECSGHSGRRCRQTHFECGPQWQWHRNQLVNRTAPDVSNVRTTLPLRRSSAEILSITRRVPMLHIGHRRSTPVFADQQGHLVAPLRAVEYGTARGRRGGSDSPGSRSAGSSRNRWAKRAAGNAEGTPRRQRSSSFADFRWRSPSNGRSPDHLGGR